jgi:hypothetical protein
MRGAELAVAIVLGALALRAGVHWGRRPFEGRDVADHLLYALFIVCRVGLWAVLATWFALLAMIREPSNADYAAERDFVDAQRARQLWVAALFVLLGGVQFAATWFLGRRAGGTDAG